MSKILVVDDSMVIRKMIQKSLETNGHEVTQAENGQEGFDRFNEGEFDLLITDINMPIMNGFELVEKVRISNHSKRTLPIVVVSTEFSDNLKLKGKNLGVNAWVVKPTNDDDLNQVVSALIKRAS